MLEGKRFSTALPLPAGLMHIKLEMFERRTLKVTTVGKTWGNSPKTLGTLEPWNDLRLKSSGASEFGPKGALVLRAAAIFIT